MRIKNRGLDDSTEDTVKDLIGYLILLKIALEEKSSEPFTLQDWQKEMLEKEGFYTTTTT